MADLIVVNALRRFVEGEKNLKTAYRAAWEAYSARQVEVTILSSQFEGGASSGQIAGDPKEIMEACEFLLKELEAAESSDTVAAGPIHSDFSTRTIRT